MLHRRHLLQALGASALGAGLGVHSASVLAAPRAQDTRFLLVFLRGGYDCASLLVPTASSYYYETRPNIAIARPGQEGGALPLTPDGYPLDSASWSGSGQMSTRFEMARALGAGALAAPPMNDDAAPRAAPRMPPALAQTAYVRAMEPTWSPATRNALAQATSPREWNLLFLASPEFMHG